MEVPVLYKSMNSTLDMTCPRYYQFVTNIRFISEKRQKFDQGEDPLDPESQQGQGFNPFGQGFNPFGQQGFQFKFHFN